METIKLVVILCVTILIKTLLFVPKITIRVLKIVLLTTEFLIKATEEEFLNTNIHTDGRSKRS